jgi:hypothetical protein
MCLLIGIEDLSKDVEASSRGTTSLALTLTQFVELAIGSGTISQARQSNKAPGDAANKGKRVSEIQQFLFNLSRVLANFLHW